MHFFYLHRHNLLVWPGVHVAGVCVWVCVDVRKRAVRVEIGTRRVHFNEINIDIIVSILHWYYMIKLYQHNIPRYEDNVRRILWGKWGSERKINRGTRCLYVWFLNGKKLQLIITKNVWRAINMLCMLAIVNWL